MDAILKSFMSLDNSVRVAGIVVALSKSCFGQTTDIGGWSTVEVVQVHLHISRRFSLSRENVQDQNHSQSIKRSRQ
jgi:hypothetical protein